MRHNPQCQRALAWLPLCSVTAKRQALLLLYIIYCMVMDDDVGINILIIYIMHAPPAPASAQSPFATQDQLMEIHSVTPKARRRSSAIAYDSVGRPTCLP